VVNSLVEFVAGLEEFIDLMAKLGKFYKLLLELSNTFAGKQISLLMTLASFIKAP